MLKCDFNKLRKITLPHGCSPAKLLHLFRRPFSKNTSGCLCITVITRMCHSIILIIAINCCHKKCLCAIYISKVTSSRQIHYDTRNLPPFAIVMCTVPKGIVPNIFKDVFSPKIANYSFCYQSEIRWSLLDGHYGNSLFGSMNTKNFCQTWHSSNCHCKQCENYGDDSGSI